MDSSFLSIILYQAVFSQNETFSYFMILISIPFEREKDHFKIEEIVCS